MPSQSSTFLDLLNQLGTTYWDFAVEMFIEITILFLIIGFLDLILLRKLRTVMRSAVWSLLIFKLLLPTSLPGPLSIIGIDAHDWMRVVSRLVPTSARNAFQKWTQAHSPEIHSEDGQTIASADVEIPQWVESSDMLFRYDIGIEESDLLVPQGLILWQTWVLLCWMMCVSILSASFIVRLVQVRRLIRSSAPVDPDLHSLFLDVQCKMKLGNNTVKLRISRHIHSPAIGGFWNTTILIPHTLVNVLAPDQLRLILIHELTHWRRGDLWWSMLQSLVQIVYFYHPVVWITNAVLRRLREYRVDEETIISSGTSVEFYAITLVDVTALSRVHHSMPAMSLGIVETRSILAIRVQRMLTRDLPTTTRLGCRGFLAIILLAVILFPLSGCHRAIGKLIDPDSAVADDSFDLDFPDARSGEAMQDKFDGVADKMLQREQIPDRKLVETGLIEKRLTAAGITDIAPDEVVGIVVDDKQQPIVGATIHDYRWKPIEEMTSDEQGVFRLKEFDAKEALQLLISKPGYSPRIIMGRPIGQKSLIVIMGHQTCLQGVVTGPDNQPIKGAKIIASCGGFEYTTGHLSAPFEFETLSGEDGSYRLDVCSNKYDVKVSAAGVGVSRRTGVVVDPNQSVPLPIELAPGIRFEAIVVDSKTGQPFEGFVLYTTTSPRVSARSNAQGRLVIEDQFPGFIEFHCGAGERLINGEIEYWKHGTLGRWWSSDAIHMHEKFYRQPFFNASFETTMLWQYNNGFLTFDIQRGMQPVKIVVEQGVTVTGLVRDPEGKPVAGATVAAAIAGQGRSPSGGLKVMTDDEGRYRIVLPASHKNKYHLIVHDGQYREWRQWANGISPALQTTPGQVIENLDVKLTVPGVIRGRLTSMGKPIAGRTVYSQRFDGSDHGGPTVETAADGTFELKFVSPGKHYVLAEPRYSPPDFDPKGFRVVELKAGGEVNDADWDIKGKE